MLTASRLLDFERAHPRHSGWKEEAIRRDLRLTPPRYYALLIRAADSIEGMEYDAVTARRIREGGRRRAA